MFLRFPNLDTLRLALTSGAISDAVRATTVRYGFDDDQSLWLQPSVALRERAEKDLCRLGVHFSNVRAIWRIGTAMADSVAASKCFDDC